MTFKNSIPGLLFSSVFALGSAFLFSPVLAQTNSRSSTEQTITAIEFTAEDMRKLDQVMGSGSANQPQNNVQDNESQQQSINEKFAMQIGLGGNPDVDHGKPFREKAWVVSILYPVKVTSAAGLPTTIYIEARCASLGKQPLSANTENINIRCGPGVVADAKITRFISAYARLGSVTSRFSHNGAPKGQINPKTGIEYRLYPNDTWFTGAAMGAGLKVKVLKNTQIFAEYTKYLVQQTDNPAYQFRGGFNAGISRNFWLFQGPRN